MAWHVMKNNHIDKRYLHVAMTGQAVLEQPHVKIIVSSFQAQALKSPRRQGTTPS